MNNTPFISVLRVRIHIVYTPPELMSKNISGFESLPTLGPNSEKEELLKYFHYKFSFVRDMNDLRRSENFDT